MHWEIYCPLSEHSLKSLMLQFFSLPSVVIYCVKDIPGMVCCTTALQPCSTLKDDKGDTCAGKTWLVGALVPDISKYLLLVDQ
jgi:hypothetical protein